VLKQGIKESLYKAKESYIKGMKLNPREKKTRVKRLEGLAYVWSNGKRADRRLNLRANPKALANTLHEVDKDLPELHLYLSSANWIIKRQ